MKFAKTLERTLAEEQMPEEWVEAAIQYKALKKCINKVVNELNFLGLERKTLKLLVKDHDDNIVELTAKETNPSNPIIAEYILTKSNDDPECRVKPMLKIVLDYSNENYSDVRISEMGLKIKQKIEGILDDEDLFDNSHIDKESIFDGHFSNKEETDRIIELTEDNGGIVARSREGSKSPPGSPPLNSIDQEIGNIDSEVLTPLETPRPSRKHEICIMLNSDSKFFRMLDEELRNLDRLRQNEEAKIINEVQEIAKFVNSARNNQAELYKWRELFRIYIDSEVYFKYNQMSMPASQRNGEQIKKNLDHFIENVEKSGVLTHLKRKQTVAVFNKFVEMNYHLWKVLEFQSINNEAFRKILKKFDKQTSLGIKHTFPKLISNDHIFMTGTSLAQSICYIIQNQVLDVIPQLDDYSCPICMSIAYKPIRLVCGHLFCVRCLVKSKQQNKTNCPICRRPDAILEADSSNLDEESMELMKKYFPKEVKEKLKERDRERYNELKNNSHGEKCVVM
ncbi:uncharacterized protein J8A68_002096 [[Candida] subhashii]|uniref:RING-14 protein n=1 Tax=[Candida] subhashii TaxID=561895 RepID=A0A8J5UJA5_9ASCO|nr:uncharacterized protein J8A68_002096 [[Candida] subhashii]KAG7664383.1 hypothetical protein J8A68_002096 [[Candida] subhashii]